MASFDFVRGDARFQSSFPSRSSRAGESNLNIVEASDKFRAIARISSIILTRFCKARLMYYSSAPDMYLPWPNAVAMRTNPINKQIDRRSMVMRMIGVSIVGVPT
jgi:hypothetical protein